MRRNLKQLLAEYGRVALVVYLVIFLAVLAGSWAAIRLGWQPESATGDVGALAAAYLIAKLTQPLRIAATLILTPLVARVHERFGESARNSARVGSTHTAEAPPVPDLQA